MRLLIFALAHLVTIWRGPSPALARHVRALGGETYLESIGDTMQREAEVRGLDPLLVGMVAFFESSLNPDALGAAGERGLMQLHPSSEWGRAAARDCKSGTTYECRTTVSIRWGAEALRQGLMICGSETSAIGWFRTGRCVDGPASRAVVAMRDRMRALGGGK